ncbi:MAG: gamma-glutamyl-phosphate reductase, partial [Usitatibacteraceae bacterium]
MNDLSTDMKSGIPMYMRALGDAAQLAARVLARADTVQKNTALVATADEIDVKVNAILAANARDVVRARESGNDDAFVDRLTLTEKSIRAMAQGLREVAKLPDPIGEITGLTARPSGIEVGKMRVPLGVIGMIYESR